MGSMPWCRPSRTASELTVAESAIRAGAHYADFGGNPTVVAAQHGLERRCDRSRCSVIPDCGLAPGLANVMAGLLIDTTPGSARSVQMRVGALPQEPVGALGYQLAFSPAGLINEYAEPCEIHRRRSISHRRTSHSLRNRRVGRLGTARGVLNGRRHVDDVPRS